MFLKSIELYNIRSYLDAKIDFSPGSTLLAGSIGSGKSSVLQSVEFALFGLKKNPGSMLLRNDKREGHIELELEIDNKHIRIKRTLKKIGDKIQQGAGFLSINGELQNLSATEIKARIIELLGYPQNLDTKKDDMIFTYTVYTPQEEIKKILYERKDQRLETLRRVFGIDKYKRILNNLLIYKKDLRDKKNVLIGVKQTLGDPKEELVIIIEKKLTLEKEIEGLQIVVKNNEIDLETLNKDVELLDTSMKGFLQAKTQLVEKINSKEQSAREIVLKKEFIERMQKKKAVLLTDLKLASKLDAEGFRAKLNAINQELTDLKQKQSVQEEKIKQYTQRLAETEEKLKKQKDLHSQQKGLLAELETINLRLKELLSEEEYNRIENKLTELKAEHGAVSRTTKELQDQFNDINSLETCPVCQQEVTDAHKQTMGQEMQQKLGSSDRYLSKLEDEIKIHTDQTVIMKSKINSQRNDQLRRVQIKSALDTMQLEDMMELENIVFDLKQKLTYKEDFQVKINGFEEEMSKLNEQIKEFEFNQQKLHDIELCNKDIESSKAQLLDLTNKERELGVLILEIQNRLDQTIETQYNQKKQQLKEFQIKFNDHKEKLAVMRNELLTLLEQQEKINSKIEEFSKCNSKINQINHFTDWLDQIFSPLMQSMENHVMMGIYHEFNSHFTEWFGMLIEDENLIARIDDSFAPVVVQNGGETDILHLSGGEKTSIALAYRLALNQVINNFVGTIKTRDLLILDEPTEGFSSDQLDKLRDVFDQLKVNQLIIVSHEQKIESMVDYVKRIIKRDHVSLVN